MTLTPALLAEAERVTAAWQDSALLTPRMAWELAGTLEYFADGPIADWVDDPWDKPLHEVSPFSHLDLRVLFGVDASRAWAQAVAEASRFTATLFEHGRLPFDRPHARIHEFLFAAAVEECAAIAREGDELSFGADHLPVRERRRGRLDRRVQERDFEHVAAVIEDLGSWRFRVAMTPGGPDLPQFLLENPTSSWFDTHPPRPNTEKV